MVSPEGVHGTEMQSQRTAVVVAHILAALIKLDAQYYSRHAALIVRNRFHHARSEGLCCITHMQHGPAMIVSP